MWGISVYAGLDMPEITAYIKRAARLGAKKVFTSLHIPEASTQLMGEFFTILECYAKLGLSLYADIEGKYYHTLPFERCPNLALRLDFGFSDEEIADLSQKHPLVLNASPSPRPSFGGSGVLAGYSSAITFTPRTGALPPIL